MSNPSAQRTSKRRPRRQNRKGSSGPCRRTKWPIASKESARPISRPRQLTSRPSQRFHSCSSSPNDLERYAEEIRGANLDIEPSIDPKIEKARARISQRHEVLIALHGGTGAGKSTLVNAVVKCRLLPVSSMKACTSATTQVTYSSTGHYRANVEFMTRSDTW